MAWYLSAGRHGTTADRPRDDGYPKIEEARSVCLAFWPTARDHSVPDIYALLMHRKHFASIAVTMDLIVYKRVNLQTTRFQSSEPPLFLPNSMPRARCVSYFFRCPSIHPPRAFPFSQPRFLSVYPLRIPLLPTGRLPECFY